MKRRSQNNTRPSKNTYGPKKRANRMMYGFRAHRDADSRQLKVFTEEQQNHFIACYEQAIGWIYGTTNQKVTNMLNRCKVKYVETESLFYIFIRTGLFRWKKGIHCFDLKSTADATAKSWNNATDEEMKAPWRM